MRKFLVKLHTSLRILSKLSRNWGRYRIPVTSTYLHLLLLMRVVSLLDLLWMVMLLWPSISELIGWLCWLRPWNTKILINLIELESQRSDMLECFNMMENWSFLVITLFLLHWLKEHLENILFIMVSVLLLAGTQWLSFMWIFSLKFCLW